MTIEEAQAHIGGPLSANQERFIHLLKPATIKGKEKVLVAHAWAVCQTPQLTNKIPRGSARDRGWPDDQDFTLGDFALMIHELEQNKSSFSLSARDYAGSRKSYTSADDVADWVDNIAPFGIGEDDLLTDEEEAALPRVEVA